MVLVRTCFSLNERQDCRTQKGKKQEAKSKKENEKKQESKHKKVETKPELLNYNWRVNGTFLQNSVRPFSLNYTKKVKRVSKKAKINVQKQQLISKAQEPVSMPEFRRI